MLLAPNLRGTQRPQPCPGCHQHRQNGGVISCTRANVNEAFARSWLEPPHELRMPARLTVIDPSLLVDCYQDILIDKPDICIGRFDVAPRPSFDVPRSRRKKHLPWHGFKGSFKSGLEGVASRPTRLAGNRRHVAGIKTPELIDAGAGRWHGLSPSMLALDLGIGHSKSHAPVGAALRHRLPCPSSALVGA